MTRFFTAALAAIAIGAVPLVPAEAVDLDFFIKGGSLELVFKCAVTRTENKIQVKCVSGPETWKTETTKGTPRWTAWAATSRHYVGRLCVSPGGVGFVPGTCSKKP